MRLFIDQREVDRGVALFTSSVLLEGVRSVRQATRGLEKDLEAITRQNVKGRLWRAWRSDTFPKSDRPAYEPVGTVSINGKGRSKGAIRYFTQAGVNRAESGEWLAIPTPAAGSRGKLRDITPGEWERANGQRLRFVYRGGRRSALLVAEGALNARSGRFRSLTEKRIAKGWAATIVVFVLIPFQRFANRFSIDGIVARSGPELVREFERRLNILSSSAARRGFND